MPPAFVIHYSGCKDRDEVTADLINKTKATLVESCWLPEHPLRGNTLSHIQVAKLAKTLHPTQHYLVFEDDCELAEDWSDCLKGMEFSDVLYLGYTDKSKDVTYGTHALYLSPKARDVIISHAEGLGNRVDRKFAFDHILSKLSREQGLITCIPKKEECQRYAQQKKGLKSYITGKIRN